MHEEKWEEKKHSADVQAFANGRQQIPYISSYFGPLWTRELLPTRSKSDPLEAPRIVPCHSKNIADR
jgi:hypothetical protein